MFLSIHSEYKLNWNAFSKPNSATNAYTAISVFSNPKLSILILKFCIKSKYKWGTQEHNRSLTILYLVSECYQVQTLSPASPVSGWPRQAVTRSPLSIYKWDRQISRSLTHIHTEIPESRIQSLIKMKSQLFSRNSLGTRARRPCPPPSQPSHVTF